MRKSNAVVYQHVRVRGCGIGQEGIKLFKLVNNGSLLFYDVRSMQCVQLRSPEEKVP